MFKLTTSSIFALLSTLGFGYSVSSYSSPVVSYDISNTQLSLDAKESFRIIKSPIVKVDGIKLDSSKARTFKEIQAQVTGL